MLSLLLTTKFVYGDFTLNALATFYDPILAGKIAVGPEPNLFVTSLIMGVAVFLALTAFLLLFISALYIPLPNHICDRQKIQIFEFLIRLFNEYLGDLVELLFGTRIRTYLSRIIVGVPYLFQKKPPKWCKVENRKIGTVDCRIYLPDSTMKKNQGLAVFIHGGGWCLMRPNFYDGPMYGLIVKTGMTIVSIDYKLSPEVTFPSPILECEQVIKKIYEEEYEILGIDKEKISIIGDSAGGNLTAVICQRLLKQGLNHYIKSQIMIYPVINVTDFLSPSYQYYDKMYKGTGLLNPKLFARMILIYLGIDAGPKNVQLVIKNKHIANEIKNNKEYQILTNHELLPKSFLENYIEPDNYESDWKLSQQFLPYAMNPDLNPLFGKDLHGLPEAMIITSGIDILRDEGVLYGKRLESFKVPVQWFHYERAFHGILNMPKSKQRRRIMDDISSFLKNKL